MKKIKKHSISAGDKFGRWTVVVAESSNKNNQYMAIMQCECGVEKEVSISNVVLGKSKSCGCLAKEETGDRARTHGMSKTREYATWNRMWSRCTNPIVERYPIYGGRGIRVCNRWKNFENFFEDMGFIPSKLHSIGRINNDGNYEPSNCRWETPKQQRENKSSNRFITRNGESKTVSQWSDETGIPYSRLYQRFRLGLSIDDIFEGSKDGLRIKNITLNGVTKLTTEWMKFANIPISSFYHFQRKGLSKEEIILKYLKKVRVNNF